MTVPDGTAGQKSTVPPMPMQIFKPRLADTFEKPKGKSFFRIKQKLLAEEITEDYLEPSSKRQACDSKKKTNLNAPSQASESEHSGEPLSSTQLRSHNSICFADPKEKAQKVFELYLRKNVPCSVQKCQEKCRKRITAKGPLMIIRLIGECWWADKMTGEEMSCVGSMNSDK